MMSHVSGALKELMHSLRPTETLSVDVSMLRKDKTKLIYQML